MSKALYFRVGMDTGVGGCVAPIFEDESFEYIPIPDLITTEKCTYSTCKGRHGEYLSRYIPPKLQDRQLHYDPDFRGETPVYGDGTSQQDKVRRLKIGDLLAFYAGLSPWKKDMNIREIDLYFIGYIIVEEVVKTDIKNVLDQPPNAHSKRYEYIQKLANKITETHGLELEDLVDYYKSKDNFSLKKVEKELIRIQQYGRGEAIGHSSIKDLDKPLEQILSQESWNYFVISSHKDIVVDTYAYLLDRFSKFTLVKGTMESRLLWKAIKISQRTKNRASALENVVANGWHEILGIPPGLSLQRKIPRFVPNPRYNYRGDFDKLRNILLNHE